MDRNVLAVSFLENTKDEVIMLCPTCNEELEETVEDDKLYCIKCQRTIDVKNTKSLESNISQKDIKLQER